MVAVFPLPHTKPLHFGPYLTDKVIDCRACKFTHLYPLPDAKTIDRYYSGDYFYAGDNPHSPPDWFRKEEAEYRAGLWDAYYGYLAGLLDPDKPVIDYGCGAGWFLDYLSTHGYSQWQIYGVEPSVTARRVSPVRHRLYDKLDTKTKGNVILSLVLEHIPDPARFLREDVLPHLDGRLVVVVPSEWNPLQKLANRHDPKKANWFVSPVHINYFNPASLRGLLERCGLRIVHQGATFPMELFILANLDHRGNDEQGRKNHLWRLELERKWPGIFRLYGWLNRFLGIGREVVMVGEKR